MAGFREGVKRAAPGFAHAWYDRARSALSPPPLEDIALHEYDAVADPQRRWRLTLVIPTVSPAQAFGGVTTGLDVFLRLGARLDLDLRILVDDFERSCDDSVVERRAVAAGVDPARVEIRRRDADRPTVPVREQDLFLTYNWWTTLNTRRLVAWQAGHYSVRPRPLLYLIQEYEPAFYPFSSTHMTARAAFDLDWPVWGLFNSSLLHDYFARQGHDVARAYVFEPTLSDALRPFLAGPQPAKAKRLLVYGRPGIPRNCFPAVEKGLQHLVVQHPELSEWELVSAGLAHKPVELAPGFVVKSVGKLSLEDYAVLLQTTSVGLSLMSSPHPSYPPLEMAHFGVRTVTNTFANKTWHDAHPCILPIPDTMPGTIASALARACAEHDTPPPGVCDSDFVRGDALAFVDDLATDLRAMVLNTPRNGDVRASPEPARRPRLA